MAITKERLEEMQSEWKVKPEIGEVLQESLRVGHEPDYGLLKGAAEDPNKQTSGFDIKLLKIEGSITKNGHLEFVGSVCGVEIGYTTADLSKKEVCYNPKLGKLVGVKYCFSFPNKCLHTRGEIDGWFQKQTDWNEKILCF